MPNAAEICNKKVRLMEQYADAAHLFSRAVERLLRDGHNPSTFRATDDKSLSGRVLGRTYLRHVYRGAKVTNGVTNLAPHLLATPSVSQRIALFALK
jgi:hypothetical protein